MAWITTVPDDQAQGDLKRQYDAANRRAGRVYSIVRLMSLNPSALDASMRLYRSLMFGESPLSRALRELIATSVSRLNQCHY